MLSQQQRNNPDFYGFRSGMLNIAYIVGHVYAVDAKGGFITQSNNLNHSLRFEIEEGDSIPPWVTGASAVKLVCRLIPKKTKKIFYNEDPKHDHDNTQSHSLPIEQIDATTSHMPNGEADVTKNAGKTGVSDDLVITQTLRVLRFERPQLYDVRDAGRHWEQSLARKKVPVAETVGINIVESTDTQTTSDKAASAIPTTVPPTLGRSDNSNVTKVAGFVVNSQIEVRRAEDGKPASNCLLIFLKQTEALDDLIVVRCYSKASGSLKTRLQPGTPLLVEGRVSTLLKNTGRENAAGVQIVSVIQYVHTNMSGLKLAESDSIKLDPVWRQDLLKAGKSLRDKSRTDDKKGNDNKKETEKSHKTLDEDVVI